MAGFLVRFDLRRPAFATVSRADQYRACLEMSEWADRNGATSIVLSEHHGTDDGYLPTPLVLAAAIAGRTQRAMITVSALLVPLYDPLRLAEEMAVVDIVSNGRLVIVAGLGYRDDEFAMFGVDRAARAARVEATVGILREAWTGEPFAYRGTTVRVTPTPVQQPHPMIMGGGSTPAAARRAARLRIPFMPAIDDPALADLYRAECAAQGYADGFVVLPRPLAFVHVASDPEKAWARIGPHALFDAQTYAQWQTPGQRSAVHVDAKSLADVRASGVYRVVTPDEAVALAHENGVLVFHPLMGGLDPDLGWESLELFASAVLPRLV